MKIWLLLALVVASAACSNLRERDERPRWMKLGSYTTAEFDRDVDLCTREGELDARCMEIRGWIVVPPTPEEMPKKTKPPAYPAR